MELRIGIAVAALAVAGLVTAGLSAAALGTAKAWAKWPVEGRRPKSTVPPWIGVVIGVALCGAAAGAGASLAPLPKPMMWYGGIGVAAVLGVALSGWGAAKLAGKIELSALINSPSPGGGDLQRATPHHVPQPNVMTESRPESEIAYGEPYPGLVAQRGGHEVIGRDAYAPVVPSPSSSPEVVAGQAPEAFTDGLHTTTPSSGSPAIRHTAFDTADADPELPEDATPGWVYTDEADQWYLVVAFADRLRLMRLGDFTVADAASIDGELRLSGSIEMTVWPVEEQSTEE
ncbi:hypothetical protein LX16_2440 [Stackebrandtia albiflava]|uniref:Uncharacterized protein n=1 Tax=Stackebrandtia albiflava TaxID=406432 RepID=A0A562V1L3_9ACTN|nr:hypothetical protein [Stackebrandtia albiflava]TWJ11713.1 hypothetical protein LX16_2440 [Stackebrandtia albiflava]